MRRALLLLDVKGWVHVHSFARHSMPVLLWTAVCITEKASSSQQSWSADQKLFSWPAIGPATGDIHQVSCSTAQSWSDGQPVGAPHGKLQAHFLPRRLIHAFFAAAAAAAPPFFRSRTRALTRAT